jgi:SNF2 family DNA or RNA helicase
MLKLRKYQWKGAYWLALREHGGILGDEVGLGKTATALQAVVEADAQRILIVCPKSLKPQWAAEIRKVLGDKPYITDNPYYAWVHGDGPLYMLAHYEQFRNANPQSKVASELTTAYLKQSWDVVILDEVHYIKNRKSQRAKWIKKLKAGLKIGLTGTPVAEYPQDLWSILNWLDRKQFSSFWNFVANYCEVETNRWGGSHSQKITGLLHHPDSEGHWTTEMTLKLLRKTTEPYLLVRRLEDTGVELPDLQTVDVPLTMEPDQRKFYLEVKKKAIIELTEELGDPDIWDLSGENQLIIRSAGARFTRLQQTASAPTVFKPCPNIKLDWLKVYVEGGGEPGVILTRFRHTVAAITELLVDLKSFGWTVGTYEKLGTGHNLQHHRVLIAWDAPKSRLDWEQAVGRIHRIGQERKQLVYRLAIADSIDTHCWTLIDNKNETVNLIISWLRNIQQEAINTNAKSTI